MASSRYGCAPTRDGEFCSSPACLSFAVVQVNWFRLSAMTLSKPSYDYWHSGPGASIISFGYALLAFSLAKMGARVSAAGVETAKARSSPSWAG